MDILKFKYNLKSLSSGSKVRARLKTVDNGVYCEHIFVARVF